ncbi:MAG: MFS transporter [Candidatus Lindowbacteria bacterium]|nr:MFS transporter [Candidatus Lindowbacteria bacterium]
MKRIYYGWWVVLGAFFTLFVCAGIGFFAFPVFLKAIEVEEGWSRTSLSIAGAIASLAAGFSTPAIGWAIDRFGTKAVMIPGIILMTASYLALGRTTTIYQLYVLFLIVGVGMACTTVLPCQTLVSRWFDKKRGRAMGVLMVANGAGGVVWTTASARLIEAFGWRNAYEILGIMIAAVALPLTSLVIRSSPQSMGLLPYGQAESLPEAGTLQPQEANSSGESGYTTREAFRTVSFWLIVFSTFLATLASSGFTLHIVAFLSDRGLSETRAADVWGMALGASIAARIFFGFLSEKYQKRFFLFGANIFRTSCLLLLVLFALGFVPRTLAVIQLILFYGLPLGCNAVVSPLLVSETFGVKSFGKLMGLLGIPYTIGMALGQISGGYFFDTKGNYNAAYSMFAASFLLAGIATVLAKPCFLLDSARANSEGRLRKLHS